MSKQYDVVVVGARCAGATLATVLGSAGWRVLLVDRAEFPSDTLSTHVLFPHGLQVLQELGALDRLRAHHRLHPVRYSWRVLGHEIAGTFTPVGGFSHALAVRRIALDDAILQTAVGAGAELRTGVEVHGLLGSGTDEDPVRGVLLGGGEQVHAGWVVGADGRTSTVARRLGLARTEPRQGEMAFLLGYWTGLPETGWCRIDMREQLGLMSVPCEDDVHLLSVAGPADFTRGSASARERRYLEALRQFPSVLNPRLLGSAERISPVLAAPETMMRGYMRRAHGPGWALVGDAAEFWHPATAQGITDALQDAVYVAGALRDTGRLGEYDTWREERSAEHYDWSFDAGRLPHAKAAAVYAGMAADAEASQTFLDTFTRRRRPSEAMTGERLRRWELAWAYDDGRRRISGLLDDLDDQALSVPVPACPAWTVHDLVAHLTGVAEDSAQGGFFPHADEAWRAPEHAAARERWTAGHVARRAGADRESLVRDFDSSTSRLVSLLRAGSGPHSAGPAWMVAAPGADLAVHLHDLAESLGAPVDEAAPITLAGFTVYRAWLHQRLRSSRLPALRLCSPTREWVAGDGAPATTVTASLPQLFRMITGRLSAEQIAALSWSQDPTPYLGVIAPYPLPLLAAATPR